MRVPHQCTSINEEIEQIASWLEHVESNWRNGSTRYSEGWADGLSGAAYNIRKMTHRRHSREKDEIVK